jgi:hypothetical protein
MTGGMQDATVDIHSVNGFIYLNNMNLLFGINSRLNKYNHILITKFR